MTLTSIGDMAQHFRTLRQNVMLRSRVETLAQELSSGQVNDVAAHLRGDQRRLAELDRRLGRADAGAAAATEIGVFLGTMQTALGRVDDTRLRLSEVLVGLGPQPEAHQIASAAIAGRESFGDAVSALNGRFGGQALFAGNATGGTALIPADDMLASIEAAVTAAAPTTAADVEAAIDVWFGPGGGFETTAYTGDTGTPLSRRVDDGPEITIEPRADHAALREVLAGAAMAAVVEDVPGLSTEERRQLLRLSGERALSAGPPLTGLQGRLGLAETRAAEAVTRQKAEVTSLSIIRNDMIAADPYETAVRLQEAEIRLETHYTVLARLARLSLAERL